MYKPNKLEQQFFSLNAKYDKFLDIIANRELSNKEQKEFDKLELKIGKIRLMMKRDHLQEAISEEWKRLK